MLDQIPVIVIGCLNPGEITVIAFPGVGMVDGGITMRLSTDIIPVELRMPNSEFILVRDTQSRKFIQVLPKKNR